MSEQMEYADHAKHAAHASRQVALLIAVLALFLALSETLGKSANTEAMLLNTKVTDTWNFFQAKSIRRTVVLAAADEMKAEIITVSDGTAKTAMTKQIDDWQKTAARYQSEPKPEGGEGTKELAERAVAVEHERDIALARYHNYEYASAAFQIGIVLCSAAVVTGMLMLAWAAGGVAVLGLIFTSLGLFAPHLLHF
jgi:Domain of unknown function (DUF4337)